MSDDAELDGADGAGDGIGDAQPQGGVRDADAADAPEGENAGAKGIADDAGRRERAVEVPVGSGGAYVVLPGDQGDRWDIRMNVARDWVGPVPPAQGELMVAVEAALTVVRRVYAEGRPEREIYYRRLLTLAQVGLSGPNAQPGLAKAALAALRNDVLVTEAGRVKNHYLGMLARAAAPAAAISFAAAWAAELLTTTVPRSASWYVPPAVSNWLLLFGGSACGMWLSFGARKTTLSFDELAVPEADQLAPLTRLGFVLLSAAFVGVLCSLGMVQVSIGSFRSTEVFVNPLVALIVGAFAGFSEQLVSKSLSAQATRFFASMHT